VIGGPEMARMMVRRTHLPILLTWALFAITITPAAAIIGYETRITSGTSQHTWPAISGDLIAYEDDRSGTVDIYVYNITTGTEKRLTDQAGEHYWPKIYGDRLVWWDDRYGNFDIFLSNISTGVETRITTDPRNQENADLFGDRIVWMDRRSGNFDTFLYNTTTGVETRITSDIADQWEPQIWDDRIIWMDNRSNPGYDPSYQYFDIYTYDISTGTERPITTQGWAWYGGISGNRAVWSQWRPDASPNEQIYLYDFATGTETRITSDASNHWYPKIFGDRVVWEDDRNGAEANWDIFLYNITTDLQEQVTSNPSAQWNPAIWEDRIVYEDYRDGNSQIFLYTVITRPVAQFTSDVAVGYAPLAVKFSDTTPGNVTGWLWDFGDGSTSSLRNPTHTYPSPGSYTVTLTATNAAGTGSISKDVYITVSLGIVPLPGYSRSPTDPDTDGIYEDLDGDGRLSFNDVVVLFRNMEWIGEKEPVACFDLNGNGRIDFDDVVRLFREL